MTDDIYTKHQELVKRLAKSGQDIIATLTPDNVHLWHMATGISGEVGELVDACFLEDSLNILEELGDINFYLRGYKQGLSFEYKFDTIHRAIPSELKCTDYLVIVTSDLLDLTKKAVIYNKPIDVEKVNSLLAEIDFSLTCMYMLYDIDETDVLMHNYSKLSIRYKEGYSDKAAQERADKNEES